MNMQRLPWLRSLAILAAVGSFPGADSRADGTPCAGLLQSSLQRAACGSAPGWVEHRDADGTRCCLPRALSPAELEFLSRGALTPEEAARVIGKGYTSKEAEELRVVSGKALQQRGSHDASATLDAVAANLAHLDVRNLYAAPARTGRIRVAQWNMERGQELDQILLFLGNPEEWAARYVTDPKDRPAAIQQAREMRPDILIAEELDRVTCRTGYRDSVAEVAARLKMNYAFMPEFLEIDPKMARPELARNAYCLGHGDSAVKRNLEGQVIFSRFPIVEARMHRFATQGYDWYAGELWSGSDFHKRRYRPEHAKVQVFQRLGFVDPWDALSQLRLGSRGWIEAVVEIPVAGGKPLQVKVVEAHLEALAGPKVRTRQMEEIAEALRGETRPIILGGDWNTTNSDGSKLTVWKAIRNYAPYVSDWISSKDVAIKSAFKYAITAAFPGTGWIFSGVSAFNTVTTLRNPTRKHIRFLAPNKIAQLFGELDRIDVEPMEDTNASWGDLKWLGNRDYAITFSTPKTYAFGLIGQSKLDWIAYRKAPGACLQAVKGSAHVLDRAVDTVDAIKSPEESAAQHRLGPMSDHRPQIVDFDLTCAG
jgi:endonuclease/exonuclease/phosphatase family metal-dependent hydrolase